MSAKATLCAALSRRGVVASLAATASSAVVGQTATGLPTVGFLIAQGTRAEGQWRIDGFNEGLRRHGLVDGQNIHLAFSWGLGSEDANRAAARDLAEMNPAVLIASNTQALLALRKAAGGRIPIVFVNVSDPVEGGLVDSIARPGGTITGFTDAGAAMAAKWVELLKDLVPASRTVALIYGEPMAGFVRRFIAPMEAAARQFGLAAIVEPVSEARGYEEVMRRLGGKDVVAIVADDPLMLLNPRLVCDLARQHRLPAIYSNQGFVITYGALIAYGVGLADLYIEAMEYVDRILKGARPADLPIRLPSKYRLAINLKTAEAMGLAIPPAVLARADRLAD